MVFDLGLTPVVPPKSNRIEPWEYDQQMYKKRNEVERLLHRLKGFQRIFSRFDKLDAVFAFFIHFTLVIDALVVLTWPRNQRVLAEEYERWIGWQVYETHTRTRVQDEPHKSG